MIKNNKIISLTVIGLVLGLILALAMNSPDANVATLLPLGGIIGFIVGWVWNTRSPEAKQ
jgi:small basic protein